MPVLKNFLEDATVTVGPVVSDGSLGKYIISSDRSAIFTDYAMNNHYESDNHVYMMGITSPRGFAGQSVAFAKLASSTLLWVADWTAARFKEEPTIPDPFPFSQNSDWILLDMHISPAMLTFAPDGQTPLYRITGTYYYGNKRPSAVPFDNMAFPRPPWMDDSGIMRTIPRSVLESRLTAPIV